VIVAPSTRGEVASNVGDCSVHMIASVRIVAVPSTNISAVLACGPGM
jgi:hypothetical protein